jgi:glycosyltransferase involved in cell wall biosynthesis
MRLYVAGVALRGSGYPNAENTLRALASDPQWQVEDHADWLPEGLHLWRIARGPMLGRMALALRLMAGSALALLKVMWLVRRMPGLVYVPYPAAFLLWWASWLPVRWRPRLVADAYLSLWDSAFRDRAAADRTSLGLAARLAKAFESRALRAAVVVAVDTVANKELMVSELGLSADKVLAIPLAIDTSSFCASAASTQQGHSTSLRVLFVGTLIPLHGVSVIADAVRMAGPMDGIEFEFIGDGQDAAILEALVRESHRSALTWHRDWLSLEAIAAKVKSADVCLGVFGGEGKAARVLPFKLYMALAAGKAAVTQASYSLPQGLPPLPARTVAPDPAALLLALQELRSDASARRALESEAASYYRRWLGSDALREAWRIIAADQER